MTVEELIKRLGDFYPDAEVLISDRSVFPCTRTMQTAEALLPEWPAKGRIVVLIGGAPGATVATKPASLEER